MPSAIRIALGLVCLEVTMLAADAPVHRAVVSVTAKDGTVTRSERVLAVTAADTYRLTIPVQELGEAVDFIDVQFDLAEAKRGDEGYFVLSDGRLGIFREEKGSTQVRRNPMPIFGMKTPAGTFVGIVKGLPYEFKTMLVVDQGVYRLFPRFLVKDIGFAPYEDLVVDFTVLSGDAADYSGMARVYRAYQLGRGEVIPLRERVKGNPQLAYTADSMFIRVKHGIKSNKDRIEDQTPENEPPVRVFHSFDDFMRIMRELKALGVEKAEMCSVGWNSGGFDGRFPSLFPVEPAFGGEAKLREAIACAHELGYQIVCHVCNTDFYTVSDRYNADDIALLPNGKPYLGGVLAGGRVYHPCFQRVNEAYVDEDYRRLADLGFKGTFHIDVTSCITPYPCYSPQHPCNRQQTADAMNQIGEKTRRVFGGFGSEGSCDHVARTLDYALYVTAFPSWLGAEDPLVDRLVPLWQIAYHGIILSNPYYSTIDYNYPHPSGNKPYTSLDETTRRLKVYEFGGRPTFYFIPYRDLKPIKAAYDEYQPAKYLQYEFMDYHGELAPEVFVTRYADGSEVVTNYSGQEFPYRGRTVAAKDYVLFKP